MFSTRTIGTRTRQLTLGALALLALTVTGPAIADELMLTEITVVALALETEAMQQEVASASIEDALEQVREQIRIDTEMHLSKSAKQTSELIVAGKDARTTG